MPISVGKLIAQRRRLPKPDIGWLIGLCSLAAAAYILAALIVSPEQREYHFVREDGAITALSAIFLGISSGFAGVSFYLSRGSNFMCRVFWMVSTAALGFLALDELLMYHENLGLWIAGKDLATTGVFRNWNDLIVIGYGIAGILAMIFFLPEILKYPRFVELLVAALVFYGVHTAIDATQEPGSLSIILEESAKLYCSLFLALSMFVGLLGVINRWRAQYTSTVTSR